MDAHDRVMACIDDERLVDTLRDLVDAYSPTWAEEPATRVVANALGRAGVGYWMQPVPSSPGASRANLVAEAGNGGPPALLWVGHVDTVPAPDGEEGPPQSSEEGDLFQGLGASDMKGACAAMVEALRALRASGVRLARPLAAAFVVGEEEYGDGSLALLEEVRAPVTVVGEPSGLVPLTAHVGYVECRLVSGGAGAHAALPEIGANAIQGMLAWLMASLDALSGGGPLDAVSINVRHIRGGGEKFVVPDRCEALLDVHVPPGATADDVIARIRGARLALGDRADPERLAVEASFFAAGFGTDPADPRIAPLRRAFARNGIPWEPGIFRSHSDAGLFHDRGSATIICGPGALEVAHTADEFVSLAEVRAAARLYASMALEVCGVE
jgi:acetylornithine deacetylase